MVKRGANQPGAGHTAPGRERAFPYVERRWSLSSPETRGLGARFLRTCSGVAASPAREQACGSPHGPGAVRSPAQERGPGPRSACDGRSAVLLAPPGPVLPHRPPPPPHGQSLQVFTVVLAGVLKAGLCVAPSPQSSSQFWSGSCPTLHAGPSARKLRPEGSASEAWGRGAKRCPGRCMLPRLRGGREGKRKVVNRLQERELSVAYSS